MMSVCLADDALDLAIEFIEILIAQSVVIDVVTKEGHRQTVLPIAHRGFAVLCEEWNRMVGQPSGDLATIDMEDIEEIRVR